MDPPNILAVLTHFFRKITLSFSRTAISDLICPHQISITNSLILRLSC